MDFYKYEPIIFSLLVLILLFVAIPIPIMNQNGEGEGLRKQFNSYIKQFKKPYFEGSPEYEERYQLFKRSCERISKLNKNRESDHSAKFGPTMFSDMTEDEFTSMHLLWKGSLNNIQSDLTALFTHANRLLKNVKSIPDVLDWRAHGVVSPVRDQGKCGACWAFSITETIESMNALKTGHLTNLSVQQLIDCTENGNYGCYGGDTCSAIEWLTTTNTSVPREIDYPLLLVDHKCSAVHHNESVWVRNYTCNNFVNHEDALLRVLNLGPVVAAVDAALWQDYVSGVIHFHCSDNLNHAVQIVGYNSSSPIPHYIVRNTWGVDYGDQGYVKIAMGSNMCGIAMQISHIDIY